MSVSIRKNVIMANQRVLLKKLSASLNPDAPTPKSEDFLPGDDNPGVSLPVDYTVEGTLLAPIELWAPIQIAREKRNGIAVQGATITSRVVFIEGCLIHTRNSIYQITYLNEDSLPS